MQLRKEWKDSGILVVYRTLYINYLIVPLSLEEINLKYNIKMNFLEYGQITAYLRKYFEWKEIPETREPLPRNSFLNTTLSTDSKGVSNRYRVLNKKGNQIIGEIQNKWEEKTLLNFDTIDISRSFVFHNSIFKDCYLIYTQFRTLHRRFYTNDKLHKMGIKNSDKCTFCHDESDSVEHMLLRCNIIRTFWDRINNWIEEIGFIGYKLTESKTILGDFGKWSNHNNFNFIIQKGDL